ncbi:MAG: RNA polymerase-binding protein DksA [Pseudomonadota bacterium]
MSTFVDVAVSFVPYAIRHNEEYMNDAQRAHFRSILETWRKNLLEEASVTLENMRRTKDGLADEVDLAAYEENFRLVLRARDRELKLIKKIDFSIEALKEGDYGYCDDCGTDIGIARLEARPTATKCVECKTIAELKEKQLINA